jgi:hypothetical protein
LPYRTADDGEYRVLVVVESDEVGAFAGFDGAAFAVDAEQAGRV